MRITRTLSLAATGALGALAACGGGGGEEEAAPAADLLGYYIYSDAVRGTSHLALLEQQRFLLIHEPPEAGVPPEPGAGGVERPAPGAYAGGSEGAVGWYIVQGDSIYLNSERIYARGYVTPEVLRLVFEQPLVPGAGGADYPMPFQRHTAGAAPQGERGGGSGEQGGGQGQGRQEGQGGEGGGEGGGEQ